MTKRKTGKIITFAGSPLGREQNVFEGFGKVLTDRRAKNEADALFKTKTFAEFFAFAYDSRIGEVKQNPTEISVLFCLGSYGLKDYGRVLIVKIKAGFYFEQPYLETMLWLPKKCQP